MSLNVIAGMPSGWWGKHGRNKMDWQRFIRQTPWQKAFIVMLAVALFVTTIGAVVRPAAVSTQGLTVSRNHILDGQGNIVTLVGATRWGLEFDCHGDQHYTLGDFQAMRSWGMNAVRITLSSAYWLNLANVCPDYQATVATAIHNAEQANLYVMLVLQRESPFNHLNEITHGGSLYQMPDMNAIPFWQQIGEKYASDPHIIFEIYTEPHDVSWQVWRDGGQVSTDSGPYQTPGMQRLVTLLNTVAPHHLVVVGGLQYAYDLSGVLNGYPIVGNDVVYATHPYDYSNKQPADWSRAFGELAQRAPVIASEFGEFDGGTHYIKQVLAYFMSAHTGYFAWAWTAGTGNTDLLKTGVWNGTPSAYGQYIHDAFQRGNP
jgi:endoglucanase